ncbi:MAG: pilin [Patescibacteria group bacterium]|jgi:hypothetical protein
MKKLFIEKVLATDYNTEFLHTAASGKTGFTQISTLTNFIIDQILYVAGALAIIYLIYSGILYITAAGNPDAAKKGLQGIMNAAIGIVIIVLAFFIARSIAEKATEVPAVTPTSYLIITS